MKTLLILLMLSVPAFGAITSAQLEQARQANRGLVEVAGEMQVLILAVHAIVNNNYKYKLDFSSNTVTLTAAQQQDIVDYYNSLKAQLAVYYNQLP